MKKCFKCGKEKELDEFYKHPQTADGHFGKCKECTRKDVRQNRSDKIEQYRAYDRFRYETQPHRKEALAKRYKTEAYKESRKKAHLKERNNSIKIAARNLLTNAIRDRRIKKGFLRIMWFSREY